MSEIAEDSTIPKTAMTLILCLKGTNGMVLASDSRGTFGDVRGVTAQNDTQKKLYRLSKFSGMLIAGSGEIGAMCHHEIWTALAGDDNAGVSKAMGIARTTLKTKYDEWFPAARFQLQRIEGVPMPVRPDLAVIVAGYDDDGTAKTQRVFQLVSPLDFANVA